MNKTQAIAWTLCSWLAACSARDEARVAPAPSTKSTESAPPALSLPKIEAPASAPVSASVSAPASEPFGLSQLETSLGKDISLRVSPVEIPHQHMINPVPGKSVEYVQLPTGSQMVVYASRAKPCPGEILLTGRVIEVSGAAKGPGGGRHRELQLDASSWECAPVP